jgi:fructosamine-3-kinase
MNKFIIEGLESLNFNTDNMEGSFYTQSCFPIYQLFLPKENKTIAAKVLDREDMAISEVANLKYLRKKKCPVPEVYGIFTKGGQSSLFMEFINDKKKTNIKVLLFESLLKLYSNKGAKWGFGKDNFIGPLPQRNSIHDKFESFFWLDRIEPQLKLSLDKKILDSDIAMMIESLVYKKTKEWNLNSISPTLIHGDLWSGNLLFADNAYFIDPSIAYSHPEQDLAMLELFGGYFSSKETEDLLKKLGCSPDFNERIPFWQIYPLLVHVNLFGGTYVNQLHQAVEFYD